MSYKAIVSRIHTRPLAGADNLVIGSCGAYQVIVGRDTEDGQLGVFLESDGRLSEEFATKNDLVRRKNEDGSRAGGMFDENRRVKSIKLRGAKSEGFWCPLEKLAYTGVNLSILVEGFQFSELNGHAICDKYVTQATSNRRGSHPKIQRDNKMFAKHIETGQFRRECQLIPEDAICYVTEKLHGSSFRLGHVLDEEPIKRGPVWGWIAARLGLPLTQRVWRHLTGSRNVILEHREGHGFYGEEEFRRKCVEGISLHKGEVIYGEIVGYTETGAPIMATQSTIGLKDKSIKARFGDVVDYAYGCHVGQCKAFVYRITQVDEDGHVVELSWPQVKKRCRDLGLEVVPSIGPVIVLSSAGLQWLTTVVDQSTEGRDNQPHSSLLDERHIREGVVVRWESEHGTGLLKNKGFTFSVLEGILKECGEYVDLEEAS